MAKKVTDTEIANAMEALIDAPFFLGEREKGYDCLSSLMKFYSEMGYKFPLEFEGWTLDNYRAKWIRDDKEGRRVLGRFLRTLGDEIRLNFMARGDLLIFEGKDVPAFPGIFLGNGNVFIAFSSGCRVMPLEYFKRFLKEVRRVLG